MNNRIKRITAMVMFLVMMLIPDHIIWAVTELDGSYQQEVQSDPFEKTDCIEDVDNLFSGEIEIRNEEDITEQIVDTEIDFDETLKGYRECVFEDMMNYQDVSDAGKVQEPERSASYGNPRKNSDGTVIYDCVWFGNYWQDDTNGDGIANTNDSKSPIKWRVLAGSGNDLFLLADKLLDAKEYNTSLTSSTWEKSTVRSWLNGYNTGANKAGIDFTNDNFINNAFSAKEKAAIKSTNVNNSAEQGKFGINGGSDTNDKLFLLSYKEIITGAYGFSEADDSLDWARRAKKTRFSETRGVYGYSEDEYPDNGCWWLRSPGMASYYAAEVDDRGYAAGDNDSVVDATHEGIRPALHISADSSVISPAGTVCSDGTVDEKHTSSGDVPNKKGIVVAKNTDGDRTVTLVDGSKYGKKATINTIKGSDKKTYKITRIADNAFKDNIVITKVSIGANVKAVGNHAFDGCSNLKTTAISKKLESIGDSAFAGCTSLSKISIGKAVTTIGDNAFNGCTNLKTLKIGAGVETIGADAFAGCTGLTSVTIAMANVPENLFKGNTSIAKLTIGATTKTLSSNAFDGCTNLKAASLGKNLESIGDSAFAGCTSISFFN